LTETSPHDNLMKQ